MSDKILFVDDDPNLLASVERNFRRQFTLETAEGGEAGLAKIAQNGPFAVVVADRQMPRMDGIQFLSAVKERAPDTIRMMLTGNVDLEAAIRVVNEGNIFRFLMKPCPPEVLSKALLDAREQYRLINVEKELLNKTLNGSVKVLMDILAAVETQSFGRAQLLREAITSVTERLGVKNVWEIHMAVMLAPIGCVTIPPETLVKARTGKKLLDAEEQMLARIPETSSRLLANIPRLEGVARIVYYQHKCFDGSGFPQDATAGEAIPLGARLLKILLDLSELQRGGQGKAKALAEMQNRQGAYDPILLSIVRGCYEEDPQRKDVARVTASLSVQKLAAGMILRSNVETRDDMLILSAGHQINEVTLQKIKNFDRISGIKEPIIVEMMEPIEVKVNV